MDAEIAELSARLQRLERAVVELTERMRELERYTVPRAEHPSDQAAIRQKVTYDWQG